MTAKTDQEAMLGLYMDDLGYPVAVPLDRVAMAEIDQRAEVNYRRRRAVELLDEVAELQIRLERQDR